jgi:hypothetical protein
MSEAGRVASMISMSRENLFKIRPAGNCKMFGLQGEVSSVDKISLWEELSMEPVSCGAKGTRSANHINTSILSLIIQCMIASSK